MARNILLLLLLSVVIASCTAGKKNIKTESESHLKLAVSLMSEGNYTEALRELLEAEKLSPDNPLLQDTLGLALRAKGDIEEARKHFLKAVDLDSHYSNAYNNLGVVYLDMKRWDDAIPCFEKALADILYATPENAWYNLGIAYENKRNYPKAVECYKKSIDLASANPRVCQVYKRLGRTYHSSGKYLDAMGSLEKGRSLCPKDPEIRLFLGDAYIRTGEKKRAVEEYREALRLDPSGPLGATARGYLRLLQ